MMKFEYVTITKTCVPKISKFFVVCLTNSHTLKGFRSKRKYLSLMTERRALNEQGLIALILMAGVILRYLPLRRTEGVHCTS